MKKVAILSYNIYPYLCMPELKVSGGAELQLATLAKLLSQKGYKVVFFTGDFGQAPVVTKNGFTFYKQEVKEQSKIKKVLHFGKLLLRVRPDYILERGTSAFTFLGVLFSRVLKIPFIFCAASDINFAKDGAGHIFKGNKLQQSLYHWSLFHIRSFVVQKSSQAELLKKNFDIEKNVTIIRNFPPDVHLGGNDQALQQNKAEYDAIWLANLFPYKQPEVFIELARQYPKYQFLLVGASKDKQYDAEIRARAGTLENIKVIGYIPPEHALFWMQKCRVAVNTTRISSGYQEGFSNVQLMGWMLGLPSLTLISDPDNLIRANEMGFCSGSFERLCADFKEMMENEELYARMSRNAVNYVRQHHNAEKLIEQYMSVLC